MVAHQDTDDGGAINATTHYPTARASTPPLSPSTNHNDASTSPDLFATRLCVPVTVLCVCVFVRGWVFRCLGVWVFGCLGVLCF